MDVREMRYFLAIAQEGSFTKAAERLHMTQPPLSRQMKDLEAELGLSLFERSGRNVSLTEDGMAFRERAQEVVDLFDLVRDDMASKAGDLSGEVRLACGETDAVTILAKAAAELRREHPGVTFRLLSGDKDFVEESLEKGAAELGLLVTSSIDSGSYDFLQIGVEDTWGVLARRDDPLASNPSVSLSDLANKPLIMPYRAALGSDLMAWFGEERQSLEIVATYDLAYNASRFAREGFGYAVALDGIVDVGPRSGQAFRPLSPRLKERLFVIWRSDRTVSHAARSFLERVRSIS